MWTTLCRLHFSFASAATDTVVSQFQCLEDWPRSNYRANTSLFQFPFGQLPDHGGHHRFTIFERLNNGIKLAVAKGMIRVKGTVFFDLNLTNLFLIVTAVVEYQKAPGVTKVLVNLSP